MGWWSISIANMGRLLVSNICGLKWASLGENIIISALHVIHKIFFLQCSHIISTKNSFVQSNDYNIPVLRRRVSLQMITLEWEPICITYLRLSSRHCKSLSLSHQPCQLLAIIRWLTYCTCEAGCPDCHAKGKAKGNPHSRELFIHMWMVVHGQ